MILSTEEMTLVRLKNGLVNNRLRFLREWSSGGRSPDRSLLHAGQLLCLPIRSLGNHASRSIEP